MNQLPIKPTPEQALVLYKDVIAAEGRVPNHLLAKSALYQRLLEGKKPLIAAPPLSYSYPWYSIVEGDQAQDIDPPFDSVGGLLAEDDGIARVVISQSLWEVLSRGDGESMTVTVPGWRERGFVWRAWRQLQPAADATAYLISHHDPEKGRITTPEQLDAEAQYQANRWRSELTIVRDWKTGVIDEEAAIEALQQLHGYRDSQHRERFLARAMRQKLQFLSEAFEARQRDLNHDEISEADMAARIKQERTMLLGENWKVVNGELFFDGWRLKREAPSKLNAGHYLDLTLAVEAEHA